MKVPYLREPAIPSQAYPNNYCYTPKVLIKLAHGEDVTEDFYALLDSGADLTTFPYDIADFFDIDPEAGLENTVAGICGSGTTYIHDGFRIEILGRWHSTRIAFLDGLPFPILGREGLFDQYRVTFNEKDLFMELIPYRK